MPKAQKRKPSKRGANTERVVVREELRTVRAHKKRFDAAHADGMAALKKGDYEALGDAVDRELAIFHEQATLIAKRITKSRK